MRFASLLLAAPLIIAACSASTGNNGFTTGAGGSGGATGSSTGVGGTSTSSASSGEGGSINFDGGITPGDGGNPNEVAEVFGQSAATLYKLDPLTKVITTVGDFQGCGGSVIDIALDKNGAMYGTSSSGLYKIDKTTAACTQIAFGSYPNSLSFVPQGTVDPAAEALVGYLGSAYVRIDTTTGNVTGIGDLGSGYASSGDVVSVIGGGTYLTVNGNGCGDCIVEVNPTTGALKKMIGALGHASVFGLAFWGGAAYGFDDYGELFSIDLTTGAATVIPIPGAPSNLSFYGAGSTTSAPLKPPT